MRKIIYVLSADPFSADKKGFNALLELLNELQEEGIVWKYSNMSSDYFPIGSSFISLECLKKFYSEEDLNKIDSEINTFNELFVQNPKEDSKRFADKLKELSLSCEFYLFRILTREFEELIKTLNQRDESVGILINNF